MKISKWTVFIGVFAIAAVAWSYLTFRNGLMGIFWFVGDLITIITGFGHGNLTGVGLIVGPLWALYSFAPLITLIVVLYIRAKKLSQQGNKPLVSAPTIIRVSLGVMIVFLVIGFALMRNHKLLNEKNYPMQRKQQGEKSVRKTDPKIVDEFKKVAIVKIKVAAIIKVDAKLINDIEAGKAERIQRVKEYIINPIGSNDLKVLRIDSWGDWVYFDAQVTKNGYEQLEKNAYVLKIELLTNSLS